MTFHSVHIYSRGRMIERSVWPTQQEAFGRVLEFAEAYGTYEELTSIEGETWKFNFHGYTPTTYLPCNAFVSPIKPRDKSNADTAPTERAV